VIKVSPLAGVTRRMNEFVVANNVAGRQISRKGGELWIK
jgi:hypothetical protein